MDLLFQEEPLALVRKELELFINTYWYASPENAETEPLAYDYDAYQRLEEAGILHVYTCREAMIGELVGCALYFVMPSIKHRNYLMADCDALATKLDLRGQGIGRKMFAYAEHRLRELGVQEIINRARLVYNTQHLFTSLGFTAVETVYSKKVT